MRLNSITFTSSSTWTCPAGVTSIIVHGQGGGGAGYIGCWPVFSIEGNPGFGGPGGTGGKATSLVPVLLDVTPGTTYTITIGEGGDYATNGHYQGGTTSFGSLQNWVGASTDFYEGGFPGNSFFTLFRIAAYTAGGATDFYTTSPNHYINFPYSSTATPPTGYIGFPATFVLGNIGLFGSAASNGTTNTSTPYNGAGGGGGMSSDAGPGGNGGDGGLYSSNTLPTSGSDAPPTSYGAGGGGGGGALSKVGYESIIGGSGKGAGGRLIITWAE